MDLLDLRNSTALGNSVACVAEFLRRSKDDVRENIAELQKTGLSMHGNAWPAVADNTAQQRTDRRLFLSVICDLAGHGALASGEMRI